ncbi:hypothetical protein GF380_03920 [Candidatus Uhrbacteria bacterium]|nr:hypothetical protein [Candidatus Uhrbacteria bacterium]MBD3284241.1 hypothetical protein [Candidatus Uhrbacteria bacterium]
MDMTALETQPGPESKPYMERPPVLSAEEKHRRLQEAEDRLREAQEAKEKLRAIEQKEKLAVLEAMERAGVDIHPMMETTEQDVSEKDRMLMQEYLGAYDVDDLFEGAIKPSEEELAEMRKGEQREAGLQYSVSKQLFDKIEQLKQNPQNADLTPDQIQNKAFTAIAPSLQETFMQKHPNQDPSLVMGKLLHNYSRSLEMLRSSSDEEYQSYLRSLNRTANPAEKMTLDLADFEDPSLLTEEAAERAVEDAFANLEMKDEEKPS